MTIEQTELTLPPALRPSDGRFGCGPSKVRTSTFARITADGARVIGTSHRQTPVRALVGSVQHQLRELFDLPADWEVLIGNGGASAFWDAAVFCLIEDHSQHIVIGEFSQKFAEAAAAAPHLATPQTVVAEPGSGAYPRESEVDTYALIHNETSTGVALRPQRPSRNGIVLVDATSAAGGLPWSTNDVDVYYFSPQKCFGADGGLWIALCSPAALDRIERIAATGRWQPPTLNLQLARHNSRAAQTYNTPAIVTLTMLDDQLKWFFEHGGLPWAVRRCAENSGLLYEWADRTTWASPFVRSEVWRSPVAVTIELASMVNANSLCHVLRQNGILDTDAYRGVGRNQIRVGTFPAVDLEDLARLTQAIEYVVERTSGSQADQVCDL